jgi:hypothetical protein
MKGGFAPGTFGYDVTFLQKHTQAVVLGRGDSRVLLAPVYQGRVMTSTTAGMEGPSYGWLNYKVIEGGVLAPEARKGRLEDHIYVFGGEERFWLGPEGGQFAIVFAPGASIRHVSRTIHISGDETQLDRIAKARPGVSLADIKTAFST